MVAYEDEEIEPFTKVRNVYAVRACSSFVHIGISQQRNFTDCVLCRAAIRPPGAGMRNVRRQGMDRDDDGVGSGGRPKVSNTAHLENMLMVARMIGLDRYGFRQSPARVRCLRWLGAACRCL